MFKTTSEKKKKKKKHYSSTSTRKVNIERNSSLRERWKISCRARGNFYTTTTTDSQRVQTLFRRKGFLKCEMVSGMRGSESNARFFLFFFFLKIDRNARVSHFLRAHCSAHAKQFSSVRSICFFNPLSIFRSRPWKRCND